jgi:uncharacterized protein
VKLEEAPVVGQLGPLPDGIDEPYWAGLAEGQVRIQRCAGCGAWIWGPQSICPECRRFGPEWVAIEPRGRIFSWTRTWQKFAVEFAPVVPYVTVLVELPDAGSRRILGLLLGDDMSDPRIGEPVVGVIQPPSPLTSGYAVLRWERPAG